MAQASALMPYSFPENGIGRGRVAVCIRARFQSCRMGGKPHIMAMAFSLLAGAEVRPHGGAVPRRHVGTPYASLAPADPARNRWRERTTGASLCKRHAPAPHPSPRARIERPVKFRLRGVAGLRVSSARRTRAFRPRRPLASAGAKAERREAFRGAARTILTRNSKTDSNQS